MKFFENSLFFSIALGACVYAQSIEIANPSNGTTQTLGQSINLELDFPNQLTGVQHVSLIIALQACSAVPCSNLSATTDGLGTIMYSGNYTPTPHESYKPPYQNFTLTLPNSTEPGSSILSVAHLYLLGASATPILEFKNVTVTTQKGPSGALTQSSGASTNAQGQWAITSISSLCLLATLSYAAIAI